MALWTGFYLLGLGGVLDRRPPIKLIYYIYHRPACLNSGKEAKYILRSRDRSREWLAIALTSIALKSNHVNGSGMGVGGSAAATAMGIGLGIAFLPVPSSTEAVLAVSFSFKKLFPFIF